MSEPPTNPSISVPHTTIPRSNPSAAERTTISSSSFSAANTAAIWSGDHEFYLLFIATNWVAGLSVY
ncbi:MAG TPA: hypothetical protein PKD26_09125 [Pyrinomonadaceae bacterium]|nr:hypothetical protein [Pyrinomonadaceae bacterium]